ncbi:MAG: cobalamin-dependent protein [Vulcanimicrobiaceae bacterium]|jgi:methanogenic corrinoid protein MtbC1
MTPLGERGLSAFSAARLDAISAVTERFYSTYGSIYDRFGERGREQTREDLGFHLDFLRPVLEFGETLPMIDYLCWLDGVLASRGIPTEHLALSLEWLGEYLAAHMDDADAAATRGAISAVRDGFLAARGAGAGRFNPPTPWPEARTFEAAIVAGRLNDAMAVLQSCTASGRGFVETEMHVIQPALYSIGTKWETNQLTVAQEHLASAIALTVMTMGLFGSAPQPAKAKRILLACVEGNTHTIGLRMIADAFALDGWEVQYLGPNVPTGALVTQASNMHADVVALSLSFAQHLRAAKSAVSALEAASNPDWHPRVIIGGIAINRLERVASIVGADAFARDPVEALAYANAL